MRLAGWPFCWPGRLEAGRGLGSPRAVSITVNSENTTNRHSKCLCLGTTRKIQSPAGCLSIVNHQDGGWSHLFPASLLLLVYYSPHPRRWGGAEGCRGRQGERKVFLVARSPSPWPGVISVSRARTGRAAPEARLLSWIWH